MTLALLIMTLFVQDSTGRAAVPEIEALAWFNLPEYRLRDNREVVLFFFDTRDEECTRLLPRLNRLHRKPDALVIGLTTEMPKTVEAFVRKQRVRFCVGAGSPTARKYQVEDYPTLIRLSGMNRGEATVLSRVQFDQVVADWNADETAAFENLKENWEIEAFIENAADRAKRQDACVMLYHRASAEEFAAYAQSVLAVEGNPYIRDTLEFLLGKPSEEELANQTRIPPSTRLDHSFRENPDAPDWRAARDFRAGTPVDDRPVGQLIEEYWQHISDDADDVLIRRWIARAVHGRPVEEYPALREAAFEIIRREPDWGVRLYFAGALMDHARTGDVELAEFYEQAAQAETQVYRLKPLFEYLAYAIRNGVDDVEPDDMPPPERGAIPEE